MEATVRYDKFEDKETLESRKGRARIYTTLRVGLANSDYGDIITTPKSDDIYVVTRGTWGKKSGPKIVKSFGPDAPWSEIKAYSERTKLKHGENDGLHQEGGEGETRETGENNGGQEPGRAGDI